MKNAIAGTGYVGLSEAILLAQHQEVVGLDIVAEKLLITFTRHGINLRGSAEGASTKVHSLGVRVADTKYRRYETKSRTKVISFLWEEV